MLEQLGYDTYSNRDLYRLELDRIDELAVDFRLPSEHFVCLIVGDTRHLSDGDLHRIADTLLRGGAIYLCLWGSGSGRAQSLFDDAILMSGYERSHESAIPTTAHKEELSDALSFFLLNTGAAPAYAKTCNAALVLLINSSKHIDTVNQALEDPQAFITTFCQDDENVTL